MGLPLFIHINHPCEEVDLWRVDHPELEKLARGQGYIYIEELRKIVSSHADLLEALEKIARLPYDSTYFDPIFDMEQTAKQAIEKAR